MIQMGKLRVVSDNPKIPLYVRLKRNSDGLPLWLCFRGTNSNECAIHQKLVAIFHSMKRTSPEMVSHVLLEWVHRQNVRAASRNRGVADPGHYETWLVEGICKLEEALHSNHISFPAWQCADEYSLPDVLLTCDEYGREQPADPRPSPRARGHTSRGCRVSPITTEDLAGGRNGEHLSPPAGAHSD